MSNLSEFMCDRCGKPAHFHDGKGGVCEKCGDNLCESCAGWSEEDDYECCGKCRGDELLPCPRCGKEGNAIEQEDINCSEVTHIIECSNCKSKTGICGTHEGAIAEWNRRVPTAPQWTTEPLPKREGFYMVKKRFWKKPSPIEIIFFDEKWLVRTPYGLEGWNYFCELTNPEYENIWIPIAVPALPEKGEL